MVLRIRESMQKGMETLRWYASVVNERLKVEVAVIQLLRKSEVLEKKRRQKARLIGERVFELRKSGDADLRADGTIMAALKELEALDQEITEMKRKASQIGETEE
jgi:hypothetical protein